MVNRQQHLAATDAIGCHSEPRQAAITSQDSNPVRDNMRMERVGRKGSHELPITEYQIIPVRTGITTSTVLVG